MLALSKPAPSPECCPQQAIDKASRLWHNAARMRARSGCESTRLCTDCRTRSGAIGQSGSRRNGHRVHTSGSPSLNTRLRNGMKVLTRCRDCRGHCLASQGVTVASGRRPVLLHDEAFGLVIGGLSLFILLSLLSWSHAASTWGGVSPAANWGGPVGHRLASTLIHALGGGAFLVVGLLGHAAHLWYTHARRQQRLAMGLGGMLLLLGAAPLLQIVLAQALAFMGDAGGVVGRWLGAAAPTLLQRRGHPVDQRYRGSTGWHDRGAPVVARGPPWRLVAAMARHRVALPPLGTTRAPAGVHSSTPQPIVMVIALRGGGTHARRG